MRTRREIEKDGQWKDVLILEVLLDIRDELNKKVKTTEVKRVRRKRRTKKEMQGGVSQ